jgi:hypothetical protein
MVTLGDTEELAAGGGGDLGTAEPSGPLIETFGISGLPAGEAVGAPFWPTFLAPGGT